VTTVDPPILLAAPPRGSVLVFAPHPDDESLGCGGAIALHHRQGDRVTVVFATDGAAGDPLGQYADCDYKALRRTEARRAASILGIDELVFWDYPDGALAEASDLSERVRTLLAADAPDLVYRPSMLEVHPDHRALAAGVEEALRDSRFAGGDVSYEIWATIPLTHVLDITTVWEVKRKAIEQYATQLRYKDYLHSLGGLNAYRALHVPAGRYAEAFRISGLARAGSR